MSSSDKDDLFGGDEFGGFDDMSFDEPGQESVAVEEEPPAESLPPDEEAGEAAPCVACEGTGLNSSGKACPICGGAEVEEPAEEETAEVEPEQEAVEESSESAEETVEAVEETSETAEQESTEDAAKQEEQETDGIAPKTTKAMTPRRKLLRAIMRKAGIEELPELDHLMRGKEGTLMKISDIGLFIKEPEDEALTEVYGSCPIVNRVNLSAVVTRNRASFVGSEILRAGRMYQPIQVARIEEDGALECTSGRHRLAALATIYGPDSAIPVYVESMTLNEARDAVVVANQARKIEALERAEHAVLQSVHGDVDAAQDDIYSNTATTKAKANKYCVYSVVERKTPAELGFEVALKASRKGGGLTTVTNIEGFWSTALFWRKDMPRQEFDNGLKASVAFLNKMVKAMQKDPGFDAKQHLAAMTLKAIGKYYKTYDDMFGENAIKVVSEIAEKIIAMGEIGRQKSDETYEALVRVMRKK